MQHLITGLVSFAGLLLVTSPSQADEFRYTCDDGVQLSVTFSSEGSGPGSARLIFAGSSATIDLPQVLSADGGRYAQNGMEFWIKGNSARLTRSGSAATTCHVR